LKGLIVCPVCGMRFYGRKRVDLSDNQYICCSQKLKNFCGNRGINIDKMNKIIWDLVIDLPNNMKMIMLENKNDYQINLEKSLKKVNQKLKVKMDEVENILDLFLVNDKGKEIVKSRLEKLEKVINYNVILYPNPTVSSFSLNVVSDNNEMIEVSVYDIQGRNIENKTFNKEDINSITIGDTLPTGIYNVIVKQGENIKSQRLIKK
jgi:hypothetical protein